MYCAKCGKNIESGSKFCIFCGNQIVGNNSSVNVQHSNEACQLCGANAPLKYNEFFANIGMIVMRRKLQVKGKMCSKCIHQYFWQYTLINLFLGWWGVISFFATWVFMFNNVSRYVTSLSLKESY
jgi:hypothetical protein